MNKEELKKKKEWLDEIRMNFFLPKPMNGKLYHYTSLNVLFNILESDCVWVSGTRFSNDSSEELLLQNDLFNKTEYSGDNFIICFSDKADSLSQWRGYCANGGVAVEFDIKRPRYYSVLHTDNDTSKRYELEYNVPYPVLYVSPEHLKPSSGMLSNYILDASNSNRYFPWKVRDIIPYLKDNAFCEESEWRLMFGNHDGLLSKCVRFRTLADGSKVPYMVVQFGNIGENYSRCDFNVNYYTDEVLKKMIEDGQYLINIPQGNDQESVYYKLEHIVNKFNESLAPEQHIKIFCDGHLPVRKIITAPTYNRQRIAEKIKRFCWSKYWLRNLDISYSNIPYIPPSE